ncbi:unnamed protein product [Rotaria magnacalcarata]|uniref:Uncharacterized protein n=1 Tax=Rotaria magnacalcarata TaxID=392030 RepID=A0A8S2P6U6_9BILA|nr:unnamed protein product [Rotaria magnacalcarata]
MEIYVKRTVEKEKIIEKRILICDLFLMAHKKLHEEINKRALPKSIISIVSNNHPPANNSKQFYVGQTILTLLNDAKLYQGTLIRYGAKNDWLIKFDDNTRQWLPLNRLFLRQEFARITN